MRNITVTNTSPLKVVFKWSFQENAINFESKEDDEGINDKYFHICIYLQRCFGQYEEESYTHLKKVDNR